MYIVPVFLLKHINVYAVYIHMNVRLNEVHVGANYHIGVYGDWVYNVPVKI